MKLNGYRATHRNRWLLLTNKILSEKEFLLFEYYLDSMDWDLKHEKPGVLEVFFDELAVKFDKTPETVKEWHNGLLNKGFVCLYDKKRNIYEIKNPDRYALDGRSGGKASKYYKEENSNRTIDFLLQNISFSPDKIELIPQKTTSVALKEEKALGSFKGESSLHSITSPSSSFPSVSKKVVLIKQDIRTDSEYQKMYKENPNGLTPDDMKWVDQNVSEKIVIESEQQEKDIVDVFFNGNWNEYQKHLINN